MTETREIRAQSIREAQDKMTRELLEKAIGEGFLPQDANARALTDTVRQAMSDRYVLAHAKRVGAVAQDANAAALTSDVRASLGVLYRPNGERVEPQQYFI